MRIVNCMPSRKNNVFKANIPEECWGYDYLRRKRSGINHIPEIGSILPNDFMGYESYYLSFNYDLADDDDCYSDYRNNNNKFKTLLVKDRVVFNLDALVTKRNYLDRMKRFYKVLYCGDEELLNTINDFEKIFDKINSRKLFKGNNSFYLELTLFEYEDYLASIKNKIKKIFTTLSKNSLKATEFFSLDQISDLYKNSSFEKEVEFVEFLILFNFLPKNNFKNPRELKAISQLEDKFLSYVKNAFEKNNDFVVDSICNSILENLEKENLMILAFPYLVENQNNL